MTVNGSIADGSVGMTISSYLLQENYNLRYIAVELNGTIVQKEQYQTVVLQQDDRLEVVSFVEGG